MGGDNGYESFDVHVKVLFHSSLLQVFHLLSLILQFFPPFSLLSLFPLEVKLQVDLGSLRQ